LYGSLRQLEILEGKWRGVVELCNHKTECLPTSELFTRLKGIIERQCQRKAEHLVFFDWVNVSECLMCWQVCLLEVDIENSKIFAGQNG
jgi:hypothetical protein